MKQVYSTTLRLNLSDIEERQAWEYLRQLDRKKYHSVSKAIATAVNAYFGRKEKLAADPYLETREKEDAFLQEIRDTIRSSLSFGILSFNPSAVISPPSEKQANVSDEDIEAALDFADSF